MREVHEEDTEALLWDLLHRIGNSYPLFPMPHCMAPGYYLVNRMQGVLGLVREA